MLRPGTPKPWRRSLTSLAPDIIEAILRGDLSRRSGLSGRSAAKPEAKTGLSLEKLRKPVLGAAEGNLPVRWDEQRKSCCNSPNVLAHKE